MGTAHPFEVIHFAASLIGIALNLWSLLDAQTNLSVNRQSTSQLIRMHAEGSVAQERLRFLVQIMLGFLGFVALVTPPPFGPDVPIPNDTLRLMGLHRLVLSVVAILLGIKSFRDVRDRRAMARIAEREYDRMQFAETIYTKVERALGDISRGADCAEAAYAESYNTGERLRALHADLVARFDRAAAGESPLDDSTHGS
jgi:hypothetical protein